MSVKMYGRWGSLGPPRLVARLPLRLHDEVDVLQGRWGLECDVTDAVDTPTHPPSSLPTSLRTLSDSAPLPPVVRTPTAPVPDFMGPDPSPRPSGSKRD